MNREPVLIIGGGISGLSVAWWLSRQGIPSQIWEASGRTGGKIRTDSQDGYLTEQAASILMNFRPEVNQFIDDSGLAKLKALRSARAEQNRYLVSGDQLLQVPLTMKGMLRSPLWSLAGKLRLAGELFIPKKESDDESVSDFVRRRFGNELLDKAMEPFVAGTLASDPDLANARSVLPRLTTLERRYGSITAGVIINKLLRRRTAHVQEAFSFQGGMSTLVARLSQTEGVDIRCNYRVRSLRKIGKRWQVMASTPTGDRCQVASQLVLCTPAAGAASLLSPSDHQLGELLRRIRYAPLNLVHMGLDREQVRHPLDGTGFLTPRSSGLQLNGNLWLSRLFEGRAPHGKVLLSSYLGGARHPQLCELDDRQSSEAVVDDLNRLFTSDLSPEMVRVDRHPRALPLYHGDYYRLCREINDHATRLGGLQLAANYLGGVSVRDRLLEGQRIGLLIGQQRQQMPESISLAVPQPQQA